MAGQFSLQISKFAAKSQKQVQDTVRWICLEISRRVILKTPVDTGRARGSWTPGINAIGAYGTAQDRAGVSSMERVTGALAQYKLGDTFFITSNLSYMPTLEYGRYPNPPKAGSKTVGGFSKQAPQGMVRITLLEFPGIISESAQAVR